MDNNRKINKACFLDRDGVLIQEKCYLYKPEDVELISDVTEAIATLNKFGYKVIVITNQAGVARGYFSERNILEVHKEIDRQLAKNNLYIDAYYYCPHHPEGNVDGYNIRCECRKPSPGMILKAINDFNLCKSECFMVGDKMSDLLAAKNAGIEAFLVETGYGKEYKTRAIQENFSVGKNLLSIVKQKCTLQKK